MYGHWLKNDPQITLGPPTAQRPQGGLLTTFSTADTTNKAIIAADKRSVLGMIGPLQI